MKASEKQKMLRGELYNAYDKELFNERLRVQDICRAYNQTTHREHEKRMQILANLLGSIGERCLIEPFFRCDYGYNIFLGEDFYSNFDLIILDVCEVRIGNNCLIGPRVTITTAGHPVDAKTRLSGLEFGAPISIGHNVWIGSGAIITPGVRIGDNAVIGAGAVVTRDIDPELTMGGVPARDLHQRCLLELEHKF